MRSAVTRSSPFSLNRSIIPLAAVFLAAHWFVLTSLLHQWIDDPNYTHGLFVIPMAVVLGWRRRDKLMAQPANTGWVGMAVLVIGGALYLAGILAAELFTTRVSMIVMLIGLVILIQGTGRARVLLFPLLFLLLMVPLPYIVYYKLTFPLQLQSSRLTAGFLSVLGMPAVRSGNVIYLEHYTLEVVTACSGLRSIMTLGTMAIFLTDFMALGRVRALLLVLAAVPVAVLANTARLSTTAIVSAIATPEAADSFLHEISGVGLFLFGLVILFLVGKALEWSTRARD